MQSPKAAQPSTENQPASEHLVADRSIFRTDAVHRYAGGRQTTVLPQLISPRTFAYLWVLLGLLGLSSGIAWFTKIPIYATGSAVVVRWRKPLTPTHSPLVTSIVVAAFLSPQSLSHLYTSKQVFLQLEGLSQSEGSRSVLQVLPNILSPDAIQHLFTLNSAVALQINQPAAVVILPLEPLPSGLPDSAYLGNVGQIKTEIGTRRLISFLPWIGQKVAN